MKLVLVRHGATEWSVSGRHTGRTNLALTAAGRMQAHQIKQRVAGLIAGHVVSVHSSPLVRARETAEIVMGTVDGLVIDDRLMEFDYGQYEGLTTPQIHTDAPGWTVFDGCPGGETLGEVERRVDAFLHDVRARVEADAPSGSNVVVTVFAHGHLLRILASRALGESGRFGLRLGLDTASVSTIADLRDGPALTLWNETGH